jgi:hypothetical protein
MTAAIAIATPVKPLPQVVRVVARPRVMRPRPSFLTALLRSLAACPA